MESKETNDHKDNFQNFIKLQKEIMESLLIDVGTSVLQLDELFKFFNQHFNKFHQKENLRMLLVFTHRCIKVWIAREDYLKDDIGISLVYFMADHRDNENDLNIALQIAYQIMNSIKHFGEKDIKISRKLLHELIAILDGIKSRTIVSNCIACIQLYVNIYPKSHKILSILWSNLRTQLETNLKRDIVQYAEIDILIQLIDDFKAINSNIHQDEILNNTIEHLLKSDLRQHRKCAYYLLKKSLKYFMENVSTISSMWMSNDHNKQIEQSWIIYITIMENLEEEQSHLILPSLENLRILCENNYLQPFWLEILYMRILTHNNNLVLRWSIEFILKTFTCSDLSRDTLKIFLHATNSNLLFNYEGYFLNEELFNKFLKNDLKNVLILLSEIENWKSVPLYMWLENLNKSTLAKHLTYEEVLKISACVRKLQNSRIRKEAIKMCNILFKDIIVNMSMEEYVMYVETLYNASDDYREHETFFAKKNSLRKSITKDNIFKQRFYEIFANYRYSTSELLSFLKDVPVSKHGWLKFAPFQFKLTENDGKIVKNLYGIDLDFLKQCDLIVFIKCFENSFLKMPNYDKNEKRMCHQAAISQYIFENSFLKVPNDSEIYFILDTGISKFAVETFTEKLMKNYEDEIPLVIIEELLKYECGEMYEKLLNYVTSFYDKEAAQKYAIQLFDVVEDKNKIISCDNYIMRRLDEHFKNFILQRETKKGEARIEEAFSFHRFNTHSHSAVIPHKFIDIHGLLKYHTELTKKKPRYFENSNEHRIKMRIAHCFYKNRNNMDYLLLDLIWHIVLNENNQLNITYFYEVTLGYFEIRENFIINLLKEALNLTSTQQVSIISVTYGYFLNRNTESDVFKEVELNEVVSFLLALTMGANFQTRLLAQMTLYKLLKLDIFKKIVNRQQIINSIEYASGEKLHEYLDDIRFKLHNIKYDEDIFQKIMYVTNAPFDEFPPLDGEDNSLEFYREKFMKKLKTTKNDSTIITNSTINDQIQRKMNPINDLTEPHNLIIYPIEEKSAEMYVIASLIDKLPNLGGIARTCEVLGIKNLCMDSKMHTEKSDFKNLSMTAEKSLNIIEVKPKDLNEFLMTKKLEGFSIVGAEQTNNSQSFADFKFPQKSVLLLGHEKDGIPAPLLGLLDYAVEIPQFGQVRSLNVHVTGALFMWEYCKQHLIQNK